MSHWEAPGWIVDRLRANLREAGIALAREDLDGILNSGMLRNAVAFEEMDARISGGTLPDYLRRSDGESHRSPLSPREVELASSGAEEARTLAELASMGRSIASSPRPPRDEFSIAWLSTFLLAGTMSPRALVDQALQRIAADDGELNAFQLVLRDEARTAAAIAATEIAAGKWRGPLHGMPIAVKDLLALAGTPTSAGSRVLDSRPAERTATAVRKLIEAGAIVIGKTRMPEFAYSPGSNNSHFGPTRNPHDRTRDAGGSSSGSGVAVAATMAMAAVGSDTGGSIRIPAAQCGIVGFKPTFGRVSLDGAVPLAWSLDHLGPMTHTVADAAILLTVMAGHDAHDPRTSQMPGLAYRETLETGVSGLRIGVLGDDGAGEPIASRDAEASWRAGLAALATAGAELVPLDLSAFADVRVVNYALLAMEAAVYHRRWLRERLSHYGDFARLRLLSAHAFAPGAFIRAQQARAALRAAVEARCARLDLLSTPTMPDVAPPLGTPANTRHTAPFNLLGWPAITVPVAPAANGLPLGLQLAGMPWSEATVLRAARVVEAAQHHAG